MRRSVALAKMQSLEKSITDNFNPECWTAPNLADGWFNQFKEITNALRREDRRLFDDIPTRDRPTATGDFGGEWGIQHGGGEKWYSQADIKALLADVRQYNQRLSAIRIRSEMWIGTLFVLLGLAIYLACHFGYISQPIARAVGIAVAAVAAIWGWSMALPLRMVVSSAIKKALGLT